jgi:4-amino-4-deoxy-L-arabinose transferase-like glycosyltransferase
MNSPRTLLTPIRFMEEPCEGGGTGGQSFVAFLRARLPQVLLILLLALAVRVGFVVALPDPLQDLRYRPIAVNLLEGNGYSSDASAPYGPSEAAAPAYPFYIAAVYAVFGRSVYAITLSQAFLDLATCLLVALVSFSLAPPRLKSSAGLLALIIYGIFSWPTVVWVARIYAETLTLFFMMLAVALCALATRNRARYRFGAGLACGLAILTRPDSVLLLMAIVLFLLIQLARGRGQRVASSLFVFCLGVGLALTPWITRNYVSLGKFQPLASEYANARDGYFPTGYLWWLRTWLKDETHFDYAFNPAWPFESTFFDPEGLPPGTYDSEEERMRLVGLIARYNQTQHITPDIDREFRALAYERIRRAPLRFFVLLPLYRTASMWLTGFSTSHATPLVLILRVLSVLPIHFAGLIGLAFLCRRHPLSMLLALIVLVRTGFMAYHYAPETRYMAEIYPPIIAACGVTAAASWSYILNRKRRSRLCESETHSAASKPDIRD